jgi:apolipoprotein N-acyltransferase
MTIRNSIRQSKVITFTLLFVLAWLVFSLYRVAVSFDWTTIATPTFIGLNAVGGIAGVVVLAVIIMLSIGLYGELGADDPAPESWPPSE